MKFNIPIATVVSIPILALLSLVGFKFFYTHVEPGETFVRSNLLIDRGVVEEDFGKGYRLRIPGVHKSYIVDTRYHWINFSNTDDYGVEYPPINVRIGGDNIISVDLTIPMRVIPGEAWALVSAGQTFDSSLRLAEDTIRGTLREELAVMDTEEWYGLAQATDENGQPLFEVNDDGEQIEVRVLDGNGYPVMIRQLVSDEALIALNEALGEFHLEAETVDIRYFRLPSQYEENLLNVQLQQQTARLNTAQEAVATQQQELDNYNQQTEAILAERGAWWATRFAAINDALQNGINDENRDTFVDALVDVTMVNRANENRDLDTDSDAYQQQRDTLRNQYLEEYSADFYALGIEGIRALKAQEVAALNGEAETVIGRYEAEANTLLAVIRENGMARKNALLSSTGGRAYVAAMAANNLDFADTMTFPADVVPWLLDLEGTARRMMSGR